MIIGRVFHFDAAHHLPKHPGWCKNLHGHTWKVTVEVSGYINTETRMVMDLKDLKALVKGLLDVYDHQCLNDFMSMPTCEFLTLILHDGLQYLLPSGVKMHSIQVQEGEGGYAREEHC
uniref:Putative 6-Pyruvoyl tetrahydrobiopterin synthase n=1 Tax=viral metagenome TaxID=1070528 RepID=A0A6M3KFR9_9ZZZZ